VVSFADLKKITTEGVPKSGNKVFPKRIIDSLVPESKWGETFHFDGRRYYRTPNGGIYPSATTFLGAFEDETHLIAWRKRVGEAEANRISKRSTDRGTAIHDALEHYVQGIPYDAEAATGEFFFMYEQLRVVLGELDDWSYVEHALWSDKLRVAGRCDLMGTFRKRRAILDYKNKNYVRGREDMRDYFLQGALYAVMHEERYGEKIDDIVILASEEDKKRNKAHVFIEQVDNMRDELMDKSARFQRQFAHWYDIPPLMLL